MPFYPRREFTLSFELFPPKTPAGEEAMYASVAELMAFGPDVITCTYGAGGSTRDSARIILPGRIVIVAASPTARRA